MDKSSTKLHDQSVDEEAFVLSVPGKKKDFDKSSSHGSTSQAAYDKPIQ